LSQFQRKIGQLCAMARAFAKNKRLQQGDSLTSVCCR
jgi:hypothetical protein